MFSSEYIETKQVGRFTVKIWQDEDPWNPREWDNLTKMIFFHGRYILGDKHDYKSQDYNGWDEMEKQLIEDFKPVVIYKVRMYDHSGIGLSLSADRYPFNCPWDSGWIGFILISREDALKAYSAKRLTEKIKDRCERILVSEFNTYNEYLQGEVYGYSVRDGDGDIVDSCSGFYGDEGYKECLADGIRLAEYEEARRSHEEEVRAEVTTA